MIDFATANDLIDAPTNRHRKAEKATVMIGVTYPFKRYIWLERADGHIIVTLFGHEIAYIWPTGWRILTCGYFTPTTRLAFENILPYPYVVTMQTPGTRGGREGEHKGFVRLGWMWDAEIIEITETGIWLPNQEVVAV